MSKSDGGDKFRLSWEEEICQRICSKLKGKQSHSKAPLLVGIVGIPGAGKTTSAKILCDMLSDIGCLVVPFDGYHYPKATLQSFPNSEDVIYRRGAPDTFDANALERDLRRIKDGTEEVVKVPGFDHAAGDPEVDAYTFLRKTHKVVICEGLYLLHDQDGWEDFAKSQLFDLSVFVHANVDTCIDRLKIRNKCIPGYTAEEIEIRCDKVDRTNALTVEKSKKHADVVVQSAAL